MYESRFRTLRSLPRSRILVFCAAGVLPGCFVPQGRHDVTVASLEAERDAHALSMQKLQEAERQVALAAERLLERERDLSRLSSQKGQNEEQARHVELEYERLQRESDDAQLIIDQLREELTRAGSHLRSFAADRERLEHLLASAQGRLEELNHLERVGRARLVLVRDLTHGLHQPLRDGQAALAIEPTRVAVVIPAADAYHAESGALTPKSRRIVELTADTVQRLPFARVEISENAPAKSSEERLKRLELLKGVLVELGARSDQVVYQLFDDSAEGDNAAEADGTPTAKTLERAGVDGPTEGEGSGDEAVTSEERGLLGVVAKPAPPPPVAQLPSARPHQIELWISVDPERAPEP